MVRLARRAKRRASVLDPATISRLCPTTAMHNASFGAASHSRPLNLRFSTWGELDSMLERLKLGEDFAATSTMSSQRMERSTNTRGARREKRTVIVQVTHT